VEAPLKPSSVNGLKGITTKLYSLETIAGLLAAAIAI
jgi:predicted anti-sigma-YlaC factor YlaD